MGQQQLILLVLATVIVGIAIVVGINAFSENSAKSNADALMQDAVRVANDMQAWKKKPAPFGGQASTTATDAQVADPANYTGATWALLGYATQAGNQNDGTAITTAYVNLNGSFDIGTPAANPIINAYSQQEDNHVQVRVCGMGDGDVIGQIMTLRGEAINTADITC